MGKSKFNPINIVQKTVAAVREKKDSVVAPVYNNPVGKAVGDTLMRAYGGTYLAGAQLFGAGKDVASGGSLTAGAREYSNVSTGNQATFSSVASTGYNAAKQSNGDVKSVAGATFLEGTKNTATGDTYSIGKAVLGGSTDPGAIGGEMSTFAAPPSEDPAAQKAAAEAAAEQSRPKGVSSTIFAGLNETQGPNSPKRKSARKTLLGY